ncbi:hypothetical protein EVC28_044 [Rhizobium phage RHph_I1_23]|nr:hypothetical protein EVC28_044 [Rhizobium phage RHph_I1_23]
MSISGGWAHDAWERLTDQEEQEHGGVMSEDYWGKDIAARLRERATTARQEGTGTAIADAVHFEQAASEIDRLRGALSKAETVIDLMADIVTYDMTMQGPKVMGINGSAAVRASEAARFYLIDKEASILKAEGK